MPHIHGGRDKYTSKNLELRTVMDFTWMATFLLGEVAMDVIDKYLEKSDTLPSRYDLCVAVLSQYQALRTSAPHNAFFVAFDKAKQSLIEKFNEQQKGSKHAKGPAGLYSIHGKDVRAIINRETRPKLSVLGLAEGQPHSPERTSQMEALWNANNGTGKPELHHAWPHVNNQQSKQFWIDQFMGLCPGQSIFLHSISSLAASNFEQRLLEVLELTDWKDDDSWFEASEITAGAELSCGLWYHRRQHGLEEGEKGRLTSFQYPDDFATSYDLQGRNIGVAQDNGRVKVCWQRDNGSRVEVTFWAKPAIPGGHEPHALRAVHFTPAGIDFVDSAGQAFRHDPSLGRKAAASITKEALPGTQTGKLAMEMWLAVMAAHGQPQQIESPDDARAWGRPGVIPLNHTAHGEQPQQNRPLRENDGLYPLKVFLDDRFPNGGHFRTCPKDRLADSTEDLQAFAAFLKTPEYFNHPYKDHWIGKLEASPPQVAMLAKNLAVLRTCVEVNTKTTSALLAHLPAKNRAVRERSYHLGEAGSGPIDQQYVAPPPKPKRKKAEKKGAEEAGDEQEDEGEEVVPAPPKGKKAKAGKKATTSNDGDDGNDDGPAPPPSKKGKARKKQTSAETGEGNDEDDEKPVPKGPRRRPGPAMEDVDMKFGDDDDDEIPAVGYAAAERRKKLKRSTSMSVEERYGTIETAAPRKRDREEGAGDLTAILGGGDGEGEDDGRKKKKQRRKIEQQ
ncbi:hypothetical protein LTR10_002795 [Elasticomyces elasticus]|nr:hypothetical protein LTR10_002795 [Elasticomyces elasticus]KAK4967865.1 hypothetical protein LTR42_010193 [Elasticomyces elasticus]